MLGTNGKGNLGLYILDGATKALEALPSFLRREKDDLARSPGSSYRLVPAVYRCAHLRAHAVSSMPYKITRIGDEKEIPDQEIPWKKQLKRLLWKTELSLCINGRAYWMWERNAVKTLGLKYLVAATIREKYSTSAGLTGFERNLARPGRRVEDDMEGDDVPNAWTETTGPGGLRDRGVRLGRLSLGKAAGGQSMELELSDVIYFHYPDPEVEVGPGRPPAWVAQESAHQMRASSVFASKFFQRGAIPLTLISVPPGTPEPEAKKMEAWWKKVSMGVKNAWQTVAIRSDVKPIVIGQPIRDLGMPGLEEMARRRIALAFGVPITLLEDSGNFATALSQRKSFYSETIIPECELVAQVLNEQLLEPLGMLFEFTPYAHEVMQSDEVDRVGSLNGLIGAGVPLAVGLDMLGYKRTADQDAMIQQYVQYGMQIRSMTAQAESEMKNADAIRFRSQGYMFMRSGGMPIMPAFACAAIQAPPQAVQALAAFAAHQEQLVQQAEVQSVQQQALQVAGTAQNMTLNAQRSTLDGTGTGQAGAGVPSSVKRQASSAAPGVGPGQARSQIAAGGTAFAPRARRPVGAPGGRASQGATAGIPGAAGVLAMQQRVNSLGQPPTPGTVPGNGRGRGFGA